MSLLTNIISYYKYDENGGTVVNDSTGSNNGTWNGTLGSQWTTGKINSGGNFNGTDNGVVSTIANPLMNGSFSWSAWAFFNAFGDTDSVIKLDVGTDSFWAQLYVHNFSTLHKPRFILDDGAGHQSPTSLNTALSTGQWYHLVAIRDTSSTTVKLYLNAALEGSGADGSTTTPAYDNFSMGMNLGPTAQFANAIIDEVGVWGRALSLSEVVQLYNNGQGFQFPFGISTPDTSPIGASSPNVIIQKKYIIFGY